MTPLFTGDLQRGDLQRDRECSALIGLRRVLSDCFKGARPLPLPSVRGGAALPWPSKLPPKGGGNSAPAKVRRACRPGRKLCGPSGLGPPFRPPSVLGEAWSRGALTRAGARRGLADNRKMWYPGQGGDTRC